MCSGESDTLDYGVVIWGGVEIFDEINEVFDAAGCVSVGTRSSLNISPFFVPGHFCSEFCVSAWIALPFPPFTTRYASCGAFFNCIDLLTSWLISMVCP